MAEEERRPIDTLGPQAEPAAQPFDALRVSGQDDPAHGEPVEPRAEEPALEERLAAVEARSSSLEEELIAERSSAAALREQLSLAATKYREALLASQPEVPPELVSGQSVEEIDRSLASARATVDVVRRQLAGRAAAERVPAGAPVRGAPDLSALSPREKIALALSRSA